MRSIISGLVGLLSKLWLPIWTYFQGRGDANAKQEGKQLDAIREADDIRRNLYGNSRMRKELRSKYTRKR